MLPLPFPAISPELNCVLSYGPEGWNWHSVRRPYVNLWVALRGRGTMRIDGTDHSIVPASAFFLKPDEHIHAFHEPGSPVANFSLHFVPLNADGSRWEDYETLDNVPTRPLQTLPHIINQWHLIRELQEIDDLLCTQQMPVAALQLVQMIWRDLQTSPEGPLEQLIRTQANRMLEHPDRPWPVDTLAREAGCTRAHYARCFAKVMRMPPNAYLIQLRMETAINLLRDSTLSIKQIADALGYSDAFFFCRQFTSRMGVSPRTYRHQH